MKSWKRIKIALTDKKFASFGLIFVQTNMSSKFKTTQNKQLTHKQKVKFSIFAFDNKIK